MPQWTRFVAVVAVLALAVAGFGGSAAAQTKITIAQSSQSLTFVPIYIAQNKGYFKDEGLDVNLVLAGGGPKALTALISGSAQFAASVLSDAIIAHRKGRKDVREIAALANGYTIPLVLRKDVATKRGITPQSPLKDKVAAMKGLKMGVTTPGAGTDLLVRYLMLSHGFQPDRDLQIVPVGGVDTMRAALEAGRIDGCSCLIPIDIVSVRNGLAIPFVDPTKDVPGLRGVHFGTVHASKAYNDAHPKVAEAFARAIVRATHLLATDPNGAREATRPYFAALDADTYKAAWDSVYPIMPRDPELTPDGVQKELDFEKLVLPAEESFAVPFAELVDNSWVRKAKAAVPR